MSGIGIEVDRVQWGVGNGGFHTEDVRCLTNGVPTKPPLLRVVYDCGTMRAGSVLQGEIDAWADTSGGYSFVGGATNVLVISHFDRDHVNGLPRLKAAGFTPDYVILPYLSSSQRVLQLVKNIAAKPRSARGTQDRMDDEFADGLSVDPAAAVGGLWPEAEVILIEDQIDGPDDPETSPDPSEPAADGGAARYAVSHYADPDQHVLLRAALSLGVNSARSCSVSALGRMSCSSNASALWSSRASFSDPITRLAAYSRTRATAGSAVQPFARSRGP